jgi:hypothetical protein
MLLEDISNSEFVFYNDNFFKKKEEMLTYYPNISKNDKLNNNDNITNNDLSTFSYYNNTTFDLQYNNLNFLGGGYFSDVFCCYPKNNNNILFAIKKPKKDINLLKKEFRLLKYLKDIKGIPSLLDFKNNYKRERNLLKNEEEVITTINRS